jgi:hypothetical protein
MKLVLSMLGVVMLVIAAVYAVFPAEQLPAFFPGHSYGGARIHIKHAIAAAVLGIALLAASVRLGRI